MSSSMTDSGLDELASVSVEAGEHDPRQRHGPGGPPEGVEEHVGGLGGVGLGDGVLFQRKIIHLLDVFRGKSCQMLTWNVSMAYIRERAVPADRAHSKAARN